MSAYRLAQLNIAKMKYPLESPQLSGFVEKLDEINALADNAPGFVWRLQTSEGDATSIDYFGSDALVNMSVWKDIQTLHDYVYRTAHTKVMSQRKDWFHRVEQAYTVLWWIIEGETPTLEQAQERLNTLRALGPTPGAFTFKQAFPAPDTADENRASPFEDLCPAT